MKGKGSKGKGVRFTFTSSRGKERESEPGPVRTAPFAPFAGPVRIGFVVLDRHSTKISQVAAFLVASAFCGAVNAEPLENIAYPIARYSQTLWFNPERSGEGWSFADIAGVSDRPNAFAGMLYTYQEDGTADWLLLQGDYQHASPDVVARDGVIGRVSGTLLRGRGGSCPICQFRAPVVEPSPYGSAELRFTQGLFAELWIDGILIDRVSPIDLSVARPLRELLRGRWVGTERRVYRDQMLDGPIALAFSELLPQERPHRIESGSDRVQHVPVGGSWLGIDIEGSVSYAMGNGSYGGFVHLDEAVGTARVFSFSSSIENYILGRDPITGAHTIEGYLLRPTQTVIDIFVTSPDTLVLRERYNSKDDLLPVAEMTVTRVSDLHVKGDGGN